MTLLLFEHHSNRSAARLALSDGEGALSDAQQCVTLNPGWPKGHFRQGAALESLGRLPEVGHRDMELART